MPNRLADASSPYLQQHADNPVDWFEWGDDAFAEARRRDVPVLVSIGYAACHWCHVMAHESFEDAATAAVMNEHFVNVKVDREERPDVDAVYMAATLALTGQGGWPMTVFVTPQGRPFYAGTYFPKQPHHGLPSFGQLLAAISSTWRDQRAEVDDAAGRIAAALGGGPARVGEGKPVDAGVPVLAVRRMLADEDPQFGGFGSGTKFPPSAALEFLLRHAAAGMLPGDGQDGAAQDGAGQDGAGNSAADALGLAERTLRAMAYGGLYDQLAGGFARYAVDRAWVVPHFEKMLYDNAQLARVYLHWWRLTGDPLGGRVAEETCDWMLRELRTEQGGLASSLDADTDGQEGLTYVWTPQQLVEVLGEADGGWAALLLGVTERGTFEHGASTLQLDDGLLGGEDGGDRNAARWASIRARLAAARAQRPQPARDDKVVAAWNGLAIAALAETGALLDRPDLVEAAEQAADLLLAVHLVADDAGHARLRRVSRDGRAGAPAGVLEDYADVAEGLLTLYAVTGEPAWLEVAGDLLGTVLELFADGEGGFFDTAADATDPALASVRRPRDPTEGPHPSGWTAAAGALLSYAALTGDDRSRLAAEQALSVVGAVGPQAPLAIGWGLAVTEALLDGPRELAVAGPAGPQRDALHALVLRSAAPGAVVAVGEPDQDGVPLLAGRGSPQPGPAGGAGPQVFVCRGFTCRLPTADPERVAVLAGVPTPA